MEALSWTPERKGAVYCAPACGLGCTHAAFVLATERAEALATKLGPAWTPRVWENLGWHYSVETRERRVKVHASHHYADDTSRYTCFVSDRADSLGGRWAESAADPHEAVRITLALARAEVREIQAALVEVENIIEELTT